MRMHQRTGPARQRGLSFIGLVLIGVLAVGVFAIGGQAVPTYIEYLAIGKTAEKAKAGNTVQEVQAAFDRAAVIDDIRTIQGKDLKITKRGDKVVVGYDYQREIHIAGPAYLTLKYSGETK